MAQLQHNMRVIRAGEAALSIITGGGHWLNVKIAADPLYQHLLVTAERNFWRSVVTGEPPASSTPSRRDHGSWRSGWST
jgi:hypothetical protein